MAAWRVVRVRPSAAVAWWFAALLSGCEGEAMAKMVLFSAVQGRVLEEGRPVSGATVAGSIAVTGWALDDIGIDRVDPTRCLIVTRWSIPPRGTLT